MKTREESDLFEKLASGIRNPREAQRKKKGLSSKEILDELQNFIIENNEEMELFSGYEFTTKGVNSLRRYLVPLSKELATGGLLSYEDDDDDDAE